MRNIFLILFIFFILATIFFVINNSKDYLYAVTIHAGLISLSLYLLYRKNISTFWKEVIVPCKLKEIAKYVIVGFAAIIAVSMAMSLIMNAFGVWDQEKVTERITDFPWYIALLAVMIAPLGEELFFRAYLVNKIGIISATVAFALVHIGYGSIAEIAAAFFIGLIFAYIYKKSGSLLPNLILHIIYNSLSILLIKFIGV